MNVFVARQPIFDRQNTITGYELLYRTSMEHNWASGADPRQMSSDVIIHSVLNMGLDHITGGRKAFLNFTSDMLVTDLFELLDPAKVVVELLETAVCDDYTVKACRRLAEAGYTLALDDFASVETMRPIAELAHIIKVDFLAHDPSALPALVESVREFDLQLVAEKIETKEAHELALALGFEMFQGYYFARPEILANRDMPMESVSIIRVLNMLRDPGSTDHDIEEAFSTSPALSFQLLRIVNSASHGGRGIESILHAIRLLGRDMLHRWLSLLFVSSLVSNSDIDLERAMTAIVRARLCEMIAHASGQRAATGPLFLVGLFSGLEALLQIPLIEIVSRIDLAADVRAALLENSGPYANPLNLVRAYECGDWDDVPRLASASGVSAGEVTDLYVQSLTWARERLRDREAA